MSSVGRRGSARCGLTTTAWKPDRFCGLVILFKADNGEPLAILNDGVIQHLRVGATAGMMLDEDVRIGLVDRSLTLDKIIEERLLKIAQQELRKEGKLGL